jgi:hypothetical protein
MDEGQAMPIMKDLRGGFGVSARDGEAVARNIRELLQRTILSNKLDGGLAPRSCAEFVEIVNKYAFKDAYPDCKVPLITKEDLEEVLSDIASRNSRLSSMAHLYRNTRNVDIESVTGDFLFAPPPPGKRARIIIINLAFLPDDALKLRAASVLMTRIENMASMGLIGGSQENPRALLVLDEAHFLMPQTKKQSGDSATIVGCVDRMLRVHRDKGCGLLLATQRPQDLSTETRSMLGGTRFIGKGNETAADRKALIDNIVKLPDGAPKAAFKRSLDNLQPRHFLALTGDSVAVAIRAPSTLKRVHESSTAWLRRDETNPMVEAKRRRIMLDEEAGF